MTVKTRARTVLFEYEEALALLAIFSALIFSILARFSLATSVISLISFWSAASNDGPRGGRGGLGGFLLLIFLHFSLPASSISALPRILPRSSLPDASNCGSSDLLWFIDFMSTLASFSLLSTTLPLSRSTLKSLSPEAKWSIRNRKLIYHPSLQLPSSKNPKVSTNSSKLK